MIASCIALCALSLRAGDVVVLPPAARVVAAGGLNWVLREGRIAVAERTRAIVVRVAPDGLDGVAEVRLFDGTHRLAWLAADSLAAPASPNAVATAPAAASRDTSTASRSFATADRPVARRRKRRPDFRQVDAMIAALTQGALAAAAAQPVGMMMTPGMPVFHASFIPVGMMMATPGMPVF